MSGEKFMIADLNLVRSWIFDKNKKASILKEMMENGEIPLMIPETIKFEICRAILGLKAPVDVLKRLVELVTEYIEFFTIKVDGQVLSEAVEIYKNLKNVDFATAVCLATAKNLRKACITTDHKLADYLRENGYNVLTVDEVIHTLK
nr:PIN domain-containing protein [Archaeoglobus profundus]